MASAVIKNWDNKTWLSSQNYIKSFNNFLIKNFKVNSSSKILDIGCGRGKILGALSSKLRLKKKPLGIDIVNHKDRDKRIDFKKMDILNLSLRKNQRFDLILIKQTIHLLTFKKIKYLISLCKTKLKKRGKILIFTLETSQNEIPAFLLMKKMLKKSLIRDKKIINFLTGIYSGIKKKNFLFRVKIPKKKYIKMIENRYISTLLDLNSNEISKGIDEIKYKYKKTLSFNDKLICIILQK